MASQGALVITLGTKGPSKGCSEVPGGRLPTLEHQPPSISWENPEPPGSKGDSLALCKVTPGECLTQSAVQTTGLSSVY